MEQSQTWASLLTSTKEQPERSFETQKFDDERAAAVAAWMHAQREQQKTLRVNSTTPSMLGVIKPQSLLAYIQPKEYNIGDIVIFKNMNGGNTVHRIEAVKPGYVMPKGTFNTNVDGWVPLERVVGKVTKNFIW